MYERFVRLWDETRTISLSVRLVSVSVSRLDNLSIEIVNHILCKWIKKWRKAKVHDSICNYYLCLMNCIMNYFPIKQSYCYPFGLCCDRKWAKLNGAISRLHPSFVDSNFSGFICLLRKIFISIDLSQRCNTATYLMYIDQDTRFQTMSDSAKYNRYKSIDVHFIKQIFMMKIKN
jgi:hypothetical protein